MNPNMHDADDLASLTIRELLAELTRLEERLNSRRAAAGYQANTRSPDWNTTCAPSVRSYDNAAPVQLDTTVSRRRTPTKLTVSSN